jgi:hypothetical protein
MKNNTSAKPQFEMRKFVREMITELPSYEFDALMNQVAYLDYYYSIQLKKAYKHHLDLVINKAIVAAKPAILYRNTFADSETVQKFEFYAFSNIFLYRSKVVYDNNKYKLIIQLFKTQEEAENYLVEKLSDKFKKSNSPLA